MKPAWTTPAGLLVATFALSMGALLAGALTPQAARAENTSAIEHIKACARSNVPDPGAIRAMRFTSRDRVGNTKVTRVRISGKRAEDGSRRILARFLAPPEMAGTMLLMIERDGDNELYFKTPELSEPKLISGRDQAMTLFGTDFSFEDFQNLQSFNRPGHSKQLADSKVSGHDVWVVETLPEDADSSAYESVVTSIDKKTCIALKIEMYAPGGRVRKVLNVDPNQIQKRGDVWIAHHALMKDVRDYTETQLLVESVETHMDFPADRFDPSSLRTPTTGGGAGSN
ncbi:MAG: outer membrane lipoprotein-sorting protein [Deltaproteobacteria bacterium]|nr:outer membrane lipoprotein-sorting protein [Deltaproteobacteria bacterium]MBW2413165.1 outer membrane lipoprotein-sorting protein [Deltaproteobacteria bacterium]